MKWSGEAQQLSVQGEDNAKVDGKMPSMVEGGKTPASLHFELRAPADQLTHFWARHNRNGKTGEEIFNRLSLSWCCYYHRFYSLSDRTDLTKMLFSRFVKFLILLLVVVGTSLATDQDGEDCATPGECANPEAVKMEPEDPSCPSRPHIIRCAEAHLDTNGNKKLERAELESAINGLPWLARGVLKIIGSVDQIMKKCDYDGDDAISIDYDMEQTKETCLATCFKRRAFKRAFFPECDL
jgi:hypothetical protein